MQRWAEIESLAKALAEADLRSSDEVRPTLFAADGEEVLLVAGLRPFPKHGYHDPLIELLALACPLGADRLAVSIAGRAWSLDDPLPPVVEGVGDLRQRVFCVELAVAGGPPRSVVWPFVVSDSVVVWNRPMETSEAESWIGSALRLAVEEGRGLVGNTDKEELIRQAQRCLSLGHQLALSPAGAERLAEGFRPDDRGGGLSAGRAAGRGRSPRRRSRGAHRSRR